MAAGSGEPPLNGRVALVTGSAQGIGQGIALRLAQAGASVVGVDLAPQPETAAQVRAADGKFTEYSLDITDDAEVARLVEGVDSEHGRLDILVNNAGIIDPVSFDDLDFARWRRVLEVNLDAPFRLIKAFVPFMRANGYGRVINIASGSVLGPIPLFVSYRASKMGVIGLTRALSTELGGDGITVNAVLPGITPTPMAEKRPPARLHGPGHASNGYQAPGPSGGHRCGDRVSGEPGRRVHHRTGLPGQRRQRLRVIDPPVARRRRATRLARPGAALPRLCPVHGELRVGSALQLIED